MISRRKFLIIAGGATAFPASAMSSTPTNSWRGIALGAQAQIILNHPQSSILIPQAIAEISRLEKIFSLYRADSELVLLNQQGSLRNPSFEMVELLSICDHVHTQTLGAYDPTVQSLWATYAQEIANGGFPSDTQTAEARNLIGWNKVHFSTREVTFGKLGMALTLNGIAQGFIADKVAAFLRSNGIRNTLVNTGEIAAIGLTQDGTPWPVQAQGAHHALTDMAIATSAPLGTVLDKAETVGHIFDPRTGFKGQVHNAVTVIDPSAAVADGLSTGFCLLTEQEIEVQKMSSQVITS